MSARDARVARESQALPVMAALAGLFRGGGLLPGSAYSVMDGGLLLAALLAEASKGAWCAVVGMPELGVEAAAQVGVELRRLVLVPYPGSQWLKVAAAVAESLPMVAVRPAGRVRDGDAARLAARLRDKGAVLLVVGPWPQAEAVLSVGEPRWHGLGDGHGCLRSREVVVTAVSKRAPGPRSVRLLLPDDTGAVTALSTVATVSVDLRKAG